MQKELEKHNYLLIAQYLWEAHHEILSIIWLKELKKLNKMCGMCGIKYKDSEYYFEYTNFKDGLIEYQCIC